MALDFYYFNKDDLTCLPDESKEESVKSLINLKKIIKKVYDNGLGCNCDIAFLLTYKSDLNTTFEKYKQVSQSHIDIPLITIGYYALDKIETYLPLNFYDSSIWNYYIGLEGEKKISEKIEAVLKIICNNYSNGLYQANVSKEYRKFNYRILEQSYLDKIGKSSHATFISPFVFHSGYEMKKKARELLKKIKSISGNKNYTFKWKVLLVDDYSEKKLAGLDEKYCNKKEGEEDITKKYILKSLIKKFFKNNLLKEGNINLEIDIDTVSEKDTLVDARKQIKENFYDIILVDYLLGKTDSGNRDYGDVFIKFLNEKKSNKSFLLGKYWIIPVSSFTNAFRAEIIKKGINRINDKMYILEGADFINNPALFLYNFLFGLYLQLKLSLVSKKDIINFILENLQGEDNANKQNNNDNDRKENKKNDNLRTKARRLYGLFMHKFGMREALLVDAENGSAFAKSVGEYLDNEGFEDQRFYEYTRKLIFLIGYGTHYDAPRMWEIFTFIREEVNKLGLSEKENEINILFDRIIKYLNRLTKV